MSFDFEFTVEKLAKTIPTNKTPDDWFDALNVILPVYQVNTLLRVSAFLAQMGHESADFTRLTENLNYSAEGLVKTWPKRFTAETAKAYNRKPEKIANKVYADRMGNGDEASGDGWKYRGRGIIQITGKNNYIAFSNARFDNLHLLDEPDYLLTTIGAVESACWFWKTNNLNETADAQNMTLITKRINGGTHGLEDRLKRYERAIDILRG